MDKKLLKIEMLKASDTTETLAAYLNITRSTLSKKMNAKAAEFSQSEIIKIKEKYKLTADQVNDIFFGL